VGTPDPAAVLRKQTTVLRPGGLVVPMEADLASLRWLPDTPFSIQAKSWVVEAFARAGLVMLGPRLWAVVQEAGLRPLGMIGIQSHHGPGDPVGIAVAVETIRLAAPMIVGTGVATAEEIGAETFEQRLRDELQQASAVIANPILLSAWATTGPQLSGNALEPVAGQAGPVQAGWAQVVRRGLVPDQPGSGIDDDAEYQDVSLIRRSERLRYRQRPLGMERITGDLTRFQLPGQEFSCDAEKR
jgi:hypothetical protein